MVQISVSLPDSWLRTDQSVASVAATLGLAPTALWIELTGPWRPALAGAAGYWSAEARWLTEVPAGLRCAGPADSGAQGRLVGSLTELEAAAADGVAFVLLSGEDAAGRCGTDGTWALLTRAASLGVPVVLRGGVGPLTIAAAAATGVAEVLVEEPFWASVPWLPEPWRRYWEEGDPFETRVFGSEVPIRFWARPGYAVTREARQRSLVAGEAWTSWCRQRRASLAAVDPRHAWLPAGGASGLAARLGLPREPAARLARLDELAAAARAAAATADPWGPDRGWARVAGVRYPLSQGPMANVTDVTAFAAEVARAGAFPWLALASVPPEPVAALLREVRDRGVRPVGAGLIGMATNPFLDEHVRLCKEHGIGWLLVAAGSVEQALRLEAEGFRTVLHTPSPRMLEAALAAGLRRFVWEGREAGGHVGVLGGLSLWEHLTAVADTAPSEDATVLLAGGFGDEAAARAAAPIGALLYERGWAPGLQLGSAYLRTVEIRRTGALRGPYAQALAAAPRTLVVGERVGAPTRLLATSRAQALAELERELEASDLRRGERKHRFEAANFGGLRLAAKAERIVRDAEGVRLEPVPADEALREGLFHAGARLADLPETTLAELHRTALGLVEPAAAAVAPEVVRGRARAVDHRSVAIVGMAFRLPTAEDDAEALWQLLRAGGVAIGRVPPQRWNATLLYDPSGEDPLKSYTDLGAFLDERPFDRRRFRIPPATMQALDPTQLLALELTAAALAGADFPEEEAARERCDVILGVAKGSELQERTTARIILAAMALEPAGLGAELVRERLGFDLPMPTEDSMPGELNNVTAGRVAAVFDLHGANYTVDAACASSLVALDVAVDRLRLGRCDWAITGGVDRSMGIGAYVKFCRLGALSREGSFPFDRRASGFVMGEGGAIFVLRRLEDALRDGQRILGVIQGTGTASDGRGKGITAPNPRGQRLAIERAWADAGITADGLGYVEAHGTGTQLGDRVEAETLRGLVAARRRPLGLGSLKGNIGHLKAAAGAASLVKALLSLQRDVLLPSGGYAEPRPELGLDGRPLYVQERPERWPEGLPRRVGIDAFGFGGTDAHLVVAAGTELTTEVAPEAREEVAPASLERIVLQSASPVGRAEHEHDDEGDGTMIGEVQVVPERLEGEIAEIVAEVTGYEPEEVEPELELEADLGIDTVKIAEIVGAVRERYGLPEDPELALSELATVRRIAGYVAERLVVPECQQAATPEPRPAREAMAVEEPAEAYGSATQMPAPEVGRMAARAWWSARAAEVRRATGSGAVAALRGLLETEGGASPAGAWRAALSEPVDALDPEAVATWTPRRRLRRGLVLVGPERRGVVALFPGQGSQRPGMLAELRGIDVVEATLAEADAVLAELLGKPVSALLRPPVDATEAERLAAELRQTRYTQPVLVTVATALWRWLQEAGYAPVAVAGHSLGEFAACVAADVLDFADALRLVSGRAEAMEAVAARIADPGAMVAVPLGAEAAAALVAELDVAGLELANLNGPRQTVVGGPTEAIDTLCEHLAARRLPHKRLRVSHAFHTSIVAAAAEPLRKLLDQVEVRVPRIPIYSNVTAGPYPEDPERIRELLAVQLARPVRFAEMIDRIWRELAPVGFVEVGVKRTLVQLAEEIVGEEALGWPSYLPERDPTETGRRLWAGLWAAGALAESTAAVAPRVERTRRRPRPLAHDEVVVSGVAAGVPGSGDPFALEALAALLEGEDRLSPVAPEVQEAIVALGIERVDKDAEGRIRTHRIQRSTDTIHHCGAFERLPDLTRYGIPKRAVQGLDPASILAIAAGYEALRDAGLPLVPREGGDAYAASWRLPESLAATTGIVYATAFGAAHKWVEAARGARFPRTFLLECLGLAHSHLARFLGVTGPALQVRGACASTVQALAVAEDWLATGRVERVIVVAADAATDPALLPFVAGGFLAVGAASSDPDVEAAAQPFGRDRHGTIIGAAALGMVLERAGAALERGVRPRARLLGVEIANDACHPMKMSAEPATAALERLLERVVARGRAEREELLEASLFVSHEPFTPARGGSAVTEATALRRAFGERLANLPIVNVKGYTGHPMGASLEDVVAVCALERGWLPPVRNWERQDPGLADLRLSRGEPTDALFALHLAAGFGAQTGWALYGRVPAGGGDRLDGERLATWLAERTGDRWRVDPATGRAEPLAIATAETPVVPSSGTVEVHEPRWSWRTWSPTPCEPVAVADPLRAWPPLGPNDLESHVAAWLARLQATELPAALLLPLETDDPWMRATAEALAAATRCAWRERSESRRCRIVWYTEETAPEAVVVAAALAASSAEEVALAPGRLGERCWLPVASSATSAPSLPTPGAWWLLVGGGRGVTALLARRWLTRGVRLWLVGRRPEPPAELAALDDAELRRRARALAREQGRPVPELLAALEADRELARNLGELRCLGEVRYSACDVVDPAAVTALAEELRAAEVGLEGLVQAAGVEQNARMEAIARSVLARTLAPKVAGTANLLWLGCELGVRHWIGFGSVAATVGNTGQAAYAAANGALAGLAAAVRGRFVPRVVAWTALSGAGMATRGAIPKLLERHGIEPLAPETAFAVLEELMMHPRPPLVMVHGRLNVELPRIAAPSTGWSLLTGPASDPAVADHRIRGEAVWPAVFALEALWRHTQLPAVAVEYRRAIRFPDDRDRALVFRPPDAETPGEVAECDAEGRPKRQPAYLWRPAESPDGEVGVLPGDGWWPGPTSAEVYRLLFHGPRFQVLAGTPWLHQQGGWAMVDLPAEEPERRAALGVEAMLQLAGLWWILAAGEEALPVAIRVGRPTGEDDAGDPGLVRVRLRDRDDREARFVGEWRSSTGALRLVAHFRLRTTGTRAPRCDRVPPVLVTAEVIPALDRTERVAGQRASARALWARLVATVAVGWCGQPLAASAEVEPDRALELTVAAGGLSLAWNRSHTDELVAAAVMPAVLGRVGVDVEGIAARPASFWREVAGEEERVRFGATPDAETATLVWCTKEAVLKALGKGLALPVSGVEVLGVRPQRVAVRLHGPVLAAARDLGLAGEPHVHWCRREGKLQVTAWFSREVQR